MGLYDTISFRCPECGEKIEAQSKGGDCSLHDFTHDKVPIAVARGANTHAPFECPGCGKLWCFDLNGIAQGGVYLPIKKYNAEEVLRGEDDDY